VTSLRIASWNLCQRSGDAAARLGTVLTDLGGADLVTLQEASRGGLPRFVEAAGLDWGVHVRTEFDDLLRVRGRAGGDRFAGDGKHSTGRCVAIAGRGERLRGACAFPDVPLPEKVMAGWFDLGGQRTTVVSYHAPAGVTHGINKPRQAVQVARWIASIEGPVVLAGDFNTPNFDPSDDHLVRTHWHTGGDNLDGEPGDDLLVGPEPLHTLRDALRTHLATRPECVEAIRSERPEGPLEVSYRTSDSDEGRFRFDAIWLSPHFAVKSVEYHYDAAVAAGTDHALVIADIELADRGS
jgi:endonuclease/exonuclease/phosphatase family metal-dependent hydrolase